MELSPPARRRARYLVPVGAVAITAAVVIGPQAASGAQHPTLPHRTAAQLLASLERTKLPQFSGTVVETARLGLPDISNSPLAGAMTPGGESGLTQIVTLLTGSHTAQIAYGGPERQRFAIFLSDLSETDIVHNGDNIWTYSSDSNSVTHTTTKPGARKPSAPALTTPVDPTKAAEQALAKVDPSTAVRVDRTAEVAGHPAYQVDLAPRDTRTLISSVRIALDAKTSMPLRVEIWSRQNTTSPAFSVGFTSLSMSPPGTSTFNFTKPPSATTVPQPFSHEFASPPLGGGTAAHAAGQAAGVKMLGKDWTSVWVAKLGDEPATGGTPGGQLTRRVHGPLFGSSAHAAPGTTAVAPPNGRAVPPTADTPGGPNLAQALDQLGTRVAQGHLITTSLVTILVTNDNRILIGAVTPRFIEQVSDGEAAR